MKYSHAALLLIGAATPALASPNVQDDFVGQGQIHVLNSSSYVTADPATDTIGCLTATGLLSKRNCATFTRTESYPYMLVSSRGLCTFNDKSMPNNKDSFYGKNTYAWHCLEGAKAGVEGERYYSVNGFKYPYLCNGNLGCYYDIPAAPSDDDDDGDSFAIEEVGKTNAVQPVWQFFWGSHQMGITPGHLQVLWLWVPASSKDKRDEQHRLAM
ncbi:hypothetical protein QBC40DRAFT_235292 [Triangularia verruculosa]|uniref:Uncharacterized protein n=1 Tax=Triangularia verruculosa TaxID=2587418 RepID=A0AAN6XAT6_9PEZI|nr:hypothetical protein QBC40DRAFT_235292 [Triangularia verruculosa]